MTGRELEDAVLASLPPYYRAKLGKPARHIVRFILRSAYDTIMEATCLGEPVSIRDFAIITPYEHTGHKVFCNLTQEYKKSRDHIRVKLRISKIWKQALNAARGG
jgi:hypothetical protein